MPAAAIDGTNKAFAEPVWLRPVPGDDQARFMLAQEAFLEGDPARVSAALEGISGRWQPHDTYTRTRIGILVSYAEAHGLPVGPQAHALGSGWHPLLRRAMALGLLLIGGATATAALAIDIAGRRRKSTANKLRNLLAPSLFIHPC